MLYLYKQFFRHMECFNKKHHKIEELKVKIRKLGIKYPDLYGGIEHIPVYLGHKSYTLDKRTIYLCIRDKKKGETSTIENRHILP